MNTLRHTGIGMTSQRTRTRMVERLRSQGVKDEMVLAAMNSVPRHLFVEEAISHFAYDDKSLPIGYGQTISQPYVVARMIEVMRDGRQLNKVLEVGTGGGYQAAVLAQVARQVYTVERILPLHERAGNTLKELKIDNVRLKYADGGMGWPEYGSFDGIIMAAAATHIPQALLEQLAIGGRMVLPLGAQEQVMQLIVRDEQGYHESRLESVKFVPLLIGKE
jgi:protein-L-isoaspartate(D-aspartate) O-methyltransferase